MPWIGAARITCRSSEIQHKGKRPEELEKLVLQRPSGSRHSKRHAANHGLHMGVLLNRKVLTPHKTYNIKNNKERAQAALNMIKHIARFRRTKTIKHEKDGGLGRKSPQSDKAESREARGRFEIGGDANHIDQLQNVQSQSCLGCGPEVCTVRRGGDKRGEGEKSGE